MPTTRYKQVLTVAVDCNDRAVEQVLFQQTVAAECAVDHCRLDLAKTRLSRYSDRRYVRGSKRFQGFLAYPRGHSQRILGNATGSDGSKRAKHATRRTKTADPARTIRYRDAFSSPSWSHLANRSGWLIFPSS